jgi:hypothetical protein
VKTSALRHWHCAGVLLLALCIPTARGADGDKPDDPITPTDEPIILFNGKDLTGLYPWLKETGREDPKKVFTAHDGMIHASGEDNGYLATERSYKDYRLVVEYKWGERTDGGKYVRNSGVLLHGTGADGAHGGVWMGSVEVQLAQGCVGDLIVIPGKTPDDKPVEVSLTADTVKGSDGHARWKGEAKEGGTQRTFTGGQLWWFNHEPGFEELIDTRGKDDVDSPLGEWTRVECVCDGGRIAVFINGHKVNECYDVRPSSGKILLQCEGFEVYFRRFELHPVGEGKEKGGSGEGEKGREKTEAAGTGGRAELESGGGRG